MKHLAALLLCALPAAAQEYKIAIIGLVHSHVWGHLEKIAKGGTPARLVGIAESDPVLVAEAKKVVPAEVPFFDDYRKLLDQAKPDIVWAFVENNRHLEIAKVCAPRKIHLMFEKPLGFSYKDAVAIQQLAKQNGIQVMTNYQMAWWPANYAAKAAADQGAVGKVWRLRGVVGHGGPVWKGPQVDAFIKWLTDPEQNGGGAMVDFQCYNALWALWYLGRPQSVYAQVNHLRPEHFPKVEDNSTMVLHYKNGVGLFEGSWDLPRGFQDLEVFGLDGSLYMTNQKVELRKGDQTSAVEMPKLEPQAAEPVACMVNALKTGKPITGLTGLEMNVGVVEIIDAAKRSVETGKAVTLN